jgi:hypothetical protein
MHLNCIGIQGLCHYLQFNWNVSPLLFFLTFISRAIAKDYEASNEGDCWFLQSERGSALQQLLTDFIYAVLVHIASFSKKDGPVGAPGQ